MATYKQVFEIDGTISTKTIRRIEDGAFIPTDPENRDFKDYQAWVKQGNLPIVPDPIVIDQKEQAKAIARTVLTNPLATDKQRIDALVTIVL